MRNSIKLLVTLCFLSINVFAQDVHFSQFSQTPQLINPAATGVFYGNVRGILNYRSQWGSLGNAYKTYAASFDAPVFKPSRGNKAYLGVGANFYKDVAGDSDFGNFLGGVSVSGILPVSEGHMLSVGLQAGLGQYSASLAGLTWGNQFNGTSFDLTTDSEENVLNKSSTYFDLGAGVLYEFKNSKTKFIGNDVSSFNVGIAGYHLNQPSQDFLLGTEDKVPMKIITQASGSIEIEGTRLALVPSAFYAFQESYSEFTAGLLFKLKFGGGTKYSGLSKETSISFGTHLRIGDAFIPQVYLEFSDYAIGFSYDRNTSNLSGAAGGTGGIELSIRYINRPKAIQRSSFK